MMSTIFDQKWTCKHCGATWSKAEYDEEQFKALEAKCPTLLKKYN
ncbi:MAG: hypothetical protein ACFFD4_07870 [Candidatus Odinarchaeota archaeon]